MYNYIYNVYYIYIYISFPGNSAGKESPAMQKPWV